MLSIAEYFGWSLADVKNMSYKESTEVIKYINYQNKQKEKAYKKAERKNKR